VKSNPNRAVWSTGVFFFNSQALTLEMRKSDREIA